MYPSVKSIITEAYVVLRATRVGFTHEEIDDKILMYHLHSPMSKRLFIFFMIVFPETTILTSLYVVGSKFIITSDDVMDLIINSVAIAFIMDIDNMSREFFQDAKITDHIDGLHFDTKMQVFEVNVTRVDNIVNEDAESTKLKRNIVLEKVL